MSLSMAEKQVSYDNPYAPIVRFSDFDDMTDDQSSTMSDFTLHPSIGEHSFKSISLEDLVKSFDTTINACLSDDDDDDDDDDEVSSPSLPASNTWAELIHHLQTSLREDLKLPHIAEQCQKSLTIEEQISSIDLIDQDDDDDEDLDEQLDMHSIILVTDHFNSEPVLTAEQVISDIDDILQDMTPDSGYADDFFDLSRSMEKAKIKCQTIESLQETINDLEHSIKHLSGILVDELAHRDEFEFEKETKNTFISLVLNIQNKRQFHQGDKRAKRRSLLGLTTSTSVDAGIFLNTVIPYDSRYLTVENLQNLNKILHAMIDESPQVPELLTNYILKVLCPS